jgi:hypothetical protein
MRYAVSVDELILHRKVEVGERGQQATHQLFPGADAAERCRDARDVNDAVWCKRRVRHGHIPAVETFDPDALVL